MKRTKNSPRRRPIKGALLERKKAQIIESLQDHLNWDQSSAAVGVDRRLVFEWRKADPEFEEACRQAREMALDRLEAKAFEVGLNEHGNYYEKDALLNRFFILKGYRPHFKDSYRPEVAVREVTFTFNIPGSERLLRSANPELPEHVIDAEVLEAG